MCSFFYGIAHQPAGITHNNSAGDPYHLLIFHVPPSNKPTITDVDLCHKKFGRPWFTETRAIRYQPSVSVHNASFHSQRRTTWPPTKHVKITSFSLPIYSTLKFTYVIEYDRRPQSDTQTERNIHEVTKCNQLQYVKYNKHSQSHRSR
jgi:hypothetical protein